MIPILLLCENIELVEDIFDKILKHSDKMNIEYQ